jgi:hypothetical protein
MPRLLYHFLAISGLSIGPVSQGDRKGRLYVVRLYPSAPDFGEIACYAVP